MAGSKFIIIVLAGACLVLIWMNFSPGQTSASGLQLSSQTSTPDDKLDKLISRIEALEADLTNELVQRHQIERRLYELERLVPDFTPASSEQPPSEISTPSAKIDEPTTQETQSLENNLLAAGMAPEIIEAMQQRMDQNRLAMLQLRDQATREGWNDSSEYQEKMFELRDSSRGIREEFGERQYDQYLYASGRPNRVVVREVYSGSAADLAGLQTGDIIVSYASANIYSMSELREATVDGTAGETVLLEILRDDTPISTSVPRGPLGISMNSTRIQPQ